MDIIISTELNLCPYALSIVVSKANVEWADKESRAESIIISRISE